MSYDLGDMVGDAINSIQNNWHIIPDRIQPLFQFISQHSGAIIALAGLAFGILQWYWSWQTKMFGELERLLDKDDKDLRRAGRQVVEAISRPGPATHIDAPTFSEDAVSRLLQTGTWRNILGINVSAKAFDSRIERAIERVNQRLIWIERRKSSFDQQLSIAHLIRGAIAAEHALRTSNHQDKLEFDLRARESFGEALNLDRNNLLAIECFGEQNIRIGDTKAALQSFEDLARLAQTNEARGLAEWRKAEILFQLRKPHPANRQMIAALQRLPQQHTSDLRSVFRLAHIHELHYKIRLEARVQTAANSLQSAEALYLQIVNEINIRRSTIWRRLNLWWLSLWNQDRLQELHNRASEALRRLGEPVQFENNLPVASMGIPTGSTTQRIATSAQDRHRKRTHLQQWRASRSAKPSPA